MADTVSPESSLNAFALLRATSVRFRREMEVTEQYSAEGLLGLLVERHITSVDVVTVFCKRAANA